MDAERARELAGFIREGLEIPGNEELVSALEELASVRAELSKINDIRNSIIGTQSINWSEHIYPLVAALEAAGFSGMEYDEARKNIGTLLERNSSLESELGQLREENAALAEHLTDNTCQGVRIDDTRCTRCGTRTCGEAREFLAEREKGKS